jgi:hypothetical protein
MAAAGTMIRMTDSLSPQLKSNPTAAVSSPTALRLNGIPERPPAERLWQANLCASLQLPAKVPQTDARERMRGVRK